MLKCKQLEVSYGDIAALRGVDVEVREGEAVALIGANGAGKTTLLRSISGLVPLRGGDIEYRGDSLGGRSPEIRVRGGIAHVPEGRRIFPGLTVLENLQVGATARRSSKAEVAEDLEWVHDLFPRLAERRSQLGWSLSGGEQQMLAIGRALMSRPRLLLLDEPSLGLAPRLAEDVYARIGAINRKGLSLMIVEQNTVLALNVASRAYALENGSVVLSGTSGELAQHRRIREAYLGR